MQFARPSWQNDPSTSAVSRPTRRSTGRRRRVRSLYPERAANLRRCVLVLGVLATGALPGPARADEKGDALLRQVPVMAHALAPLMGEYTVTLHGDKQDTEDHNQATLLLNGYGSRGGGLLPQSVFNLFDPLARTPNETRYLGRKAIAGETYDVVELKQPGFAFELYVGSDGLIHRGHTMLGTSSFPAPRLAIDAQTGRPVKTPEQLLRDGVVPPTQTDAHNVDIVVTGCHKVRSSPTRPKLPPPLHHITYSSPKPGVHRAAWHVALAPDGGRVAVAFTDNVVQILEVSSGETLATLDAPPGVSELVFSPDGGRLATSGEKQPVTVWDAATGRKLFALSGVNNPVWLTFTPDGRRLAYRTWSGQNVPNTLHLWDAETGQELPSPPIEDATRFAFSPDGRRLATVHRLPDDTKPQDKNQPFVKFQTDTKNAVNGRYALMLWDTADWKLLHTEETRLDSPGMPIYSPDGKWIAIDQQNGGIVLFSGETGAKMRELVGGIAQLLALRFSGDSKTLIAAGSDSRGDSPTFYTDVTTWDTITWKVLVAGRWPTIVFPDPLSSLHIAADGNTLAISKFGQGIFIYAVPGR